MHTSGEFRNTISELDQQKEQNALFRRRNSILEIKTRPQNMYFVAAYKLGQKYFWFRQIFG